MKTTILKWDHRLQLILGLGNLILIPVAWAIPYFFLAAEIIIAPYQLLSNGTHLLLQHKSLGFAHWRVLHFWGLLTYILFLGVLIFADAIYPAVFIICFMIIPQLFLYSYIWLCKQELQWLERNEFHILK